MPNFRSGIAGDDVGITRRPANTGRINGWAEIPQREYSFSGAFWWILVRFGAFRRRYPRL